MPQQIQVNEPNASRRQVNFFLVGTDGITPATGEAGGQPQISVNDGAYTNTGIGVLVVVGFGSYFAVLAPSVVSTIGNKIRGRYKSVNTAECPAEYTVEIVDFNPDEPGGSGGGSGITGSGFVSDADLKAYLKDDLMQGKPLDATWTTAVTRANNRAKGDIVSALSVRGFTIDQINNWDRAGEFNIDLAMFWLFTRLRFLKPMEYGKQALEVMDRREELKTVDFTISGVVQYPLGAAGQLSTGAMDTSTDLIVPIDPSDSRIGEVTEF